jgi:IS5 family transposase
MIAEFEDFCLWVYVVVDELWRCLPAGYKPASGPRPACSDSELIAMALIGECCGWALETDLTPGWRDYPHLFPVVPERSRFNRRRRNLRHAINAIRQGTLAALDLAQDRQCAIASVPVPVVAFHLVPSAAGTGGGRAAGADFGTVPTKKQTIFGDKLHLLVTLGGVIRDFALAPASASDVAVGAELLREQTDLTVIGDKGYSSAPLAEERRDGCAVRLLTVPRRNQRRHVSAACARLRNGARQIIETVNGQLTEQFGLARHHAHTFPGLCARLHTKLAAHTLCSYLNRLLGTTDWLQIKGLALPTN